jgi:hypothetical protein
MKHWKYTSNELPPPGTWILCVRSDIMFLEFYNPYAYDEEYADGYEKNFRNETQAWMSVDLHQEELSKMVFFENCKPDKVHLDQVESVEAPNVWVPRRGPTHGREFPPEHPLPTSLAADDKDPSSSK